MYFRQKGHKVQLPKPLLNTTICTNIVPGAMLCSIHLTTLTECYIMGVVGGQSIKVLTPQHRRPYAHRNKYSVKVDSQSTCYPA